MQTRIDQKPGNTKALPMRMSELAMTIRDDRETKI